MSPPHSPSRPTFAELFDARTATGAHLCVGLDTSPASLPDIIDRTLSAPERVLRFNECIVDATCDIAAAFKPNVAFYESMGAAGWDALRRTVDYIRRVAPGIPVLLDAKRADIGSTNEGYVRAVFDEIGADAVTVHPYLGEQALRPFLDRPGAGILACWHAPRTQERADFRTCSSTDCPCTGRSPGGSPVSGPRGRGSGSSSARPTPARWRRFAPTSHLRCRS